VIIADATLALERFVAVGGVDLHSAPTLELTEIMIAWYVSERTDDAVPLEEDGDMLLFQWGEYGWGSAPTFQYDLTRQLTSVAEVDDDALWQLSVTRHFEVTDETKGLGSGNRWCYHPEEVAEFTAFVESSAVAAFAREATPLRTEIHLGLAG